MSAEVLRCGGAEGVEYGRVGRNVLTCDVLTF